jgi:hypothetical protein
MQDSPSPEQLLAAVARFLRDETGPALGRTGQDALAYHARVAANMLDIVARQLQLAPTADADELARLRALLADPASTDGLAGLNQRLAERIQQGDLGTEHPALTEHLWRTTLAKLAVDQPGYATYHQSLASAAAADLDPGSAR